MSALSRPYEHTGGFGDLVQREGVLERQLTEVHASGWRIAVHATGDRGIDRVPGLETALATEIYARLVEAGDADKDFSYIYQARLAAGRGKG